MVNYTYYLQLAIEAAKTHGVEAQFVDDMPQSIRPTPVRGAFRMGEVLLPKNNPEEALFVLLHGLGHMAQWSLYPEEHERSYFYNARGNSWDDAHLREIWEHEFSALPFVLGFLNKHGLGDIEDWYVCHFMADQQYLAEIFRNNQYDVQKFFMILSQTKVEERFEAASFPMLAATFKAEGYIKFL